MVGTLIELDCDHFTDPDAALAHGHALEDAGRIGIVSFEIDLVAQQGGDSPNQTISMVKTSPATITNMPIRNCMTRSFISPLLFPRYWQPVVRRRVDSVQLPPERSWAISRSRSPASPRTN